MNICRLCLFAILAAPLLCSQDKTERLTFEVASIKRSQPGGGGGGIKALPGGQEYTARGVPVKLIVSLMYKIPMRQITGGPGWLETDFFDIEAKADRSRTLDELHTMFQNLLADEFKLQFHKEIKEGPVYALSVDKSGLKMTENDSPEPFEIPITGGRDFTFMGKRVPMNYLCWWLGSVPLQRDGRPVIDKTGLDKNYDFTLSFAPDLPQEVVRKSVPSEVMDRPSIFDALKRQLGLRLEATKGPVEYYVIDHVEKPAEN